MGYLKAEDILPKELIQLIQQYVDGENIYIPRMQHNRRQWGQKTRIRQELALRNTCIIEDYRNGSSVSELAESYFLSTKSIQRIVREFNKIM
ncbi:MAG: CD3324 family protein [Lachnospiraceae bacterium]